MWEYIDERRGRIAFDAYQHASLVLQAVLVATVIAIIIAVLITRAPRLEPVANMVSAIGLTIPSFALIGLMLPVFGLGVPTAFVVVAFYATLPVLRNAVVGLQGVDPVLLESARGMGMNGFTSLVRVRLPLAWPVIFAGVRISTQMSMGIAAIAALVVAPGLGSYIFNGLVRIGGANALNSAIVGTVGIVIIALLADGLLLLLGRLTISKGIRA